MERLRINTLYEALEIIKEEFEQVKLGIEEVGIEYALGRFLAEDIVANDDIPGFDRAAVDGFAVVCSDTYSASDEKPVIFNQIGESEPGKDCKISLGQNECVYVSEGAMMPINGNAVVSLEDSEVTGPLEVTINRPIEKWMNVIRKGDDYKEGNKVLLKGTQIGPREIGALAGTGVGYIKVYKRVHISIISTGQELIEPFRSVLLPGCVRDINSYVLGADLKSFGGIVVHRGIVKDNSKDMENAIEKSLGSSDIIIITGGSSTGLMDKTLNVIKRIEGVEILVDRLGIVPGSNTIIAKVDNRAVFGLPGNPNAALLVNDLIVKPLILWLNKSRKKRMTIKARCRDDYNKTTPDMEEYVMVELDKNEGEFVAIPMTTSKKVISSMVKANGYIRIRACEEGVKEGQEVEVFLL